MWMEVNAPDGHPEDRLLGSTLVTWIVHLDKQALTRQARKQYETFVRQVGTTPPIYVDNLDDAPKQIAQGATTKSGKPFFIVNQRAHHWTSSDTAWYSPSDAELESHVAEGKWRKIAPADASNQFYNLYRQTAVRMGVFPIPTMYTEAPNPEDAVTPGAQARMSRDGTLYILVSSGLDKLLSPLQVQAVLAHELAHHKNGDTSFRIMAKMHNDDKLSRARESKADADGTGPHGTCGPLELATALKILRASELASYLKENPSSNEAEFNKAAMDDDPEHSPFQTRINTLSALAAHLPKACRQPMGP
jgi:Peptidase family M48